MDDSVVCIDKEIPFTIPSNWVWCRGYSCFAGMTSKKPSGEYFDYIDIESINNESHTINKPKHILVTDAPSRASRAVASGSVLFSFVRPYLENIAFINDNYSQCIASTGFYICNSNGCLFPQYMFLLMTSKYVIDGLNQFMKGDNSPSISKVNIESWLYPVPPINEQKIICEKVQVAIKELLMEQRTEWTGTATELVEQLDENDVTANAVTKYISRYYADALLPAGIVFKSKRTGKCRILMFKRSDGCDGNDGFSGTR